MIFKTPWVLALIPMAWAILLIFARRARKPVILFPSRELLRGIRDSWKVRFRLIPEVLRFLVVTLFLVALAGPRSVQEESIRKTEGIDIVLTIDISGSMAAEDFRVQGRRVNRLDVVKDVVDGFIDRRDNDRIGMVVFAGVAYTVSPMTLDYQWLRKNLERVRLGLIDDSSTAVGSAIAASLARLRDSDAKSKIIILLTDGKNTSGSIDPVDAARAAKAYGIKIYTIGVGSDGPVKYPRFDIYGQKVYQDVIIEFDDESLKEIADLTGGRYFFARDTKALQEIYGEIDKMEKVQIEETGYFEYTELFHLFLLIGLGLLLLEMILSRTVFLIFP